MTPNIPLNTVIRYLFHFNHFTSESNLFSLSMTHHDYYYYYCCHLSPIRGITGSVLLAVWALSSAGAFISWPELSHSTGWPEVTVHYKHLAQ